MGKGTGRSGSLTANFFFGGLLAARLLEPLGDVRIPDELPGIVAPVEVAVGAIRVVLFQFGTAGLARL